MSFCRNNGEEEDVNVNSVVVNHKIVVIVVFDLTNRFHVAVRLFSNRSQMMSKCGKNEEVAHEPQASACH